MLSGNEVVLGYDEHGALDQACVSNVRPHSYAWRVGACAWPKNILTQSLIYLEKLCGGFSLPCPTKLPQRSQGFL